MSSIQSAITQWGYPVGLGLPHPAGRCLPGGSAFSSPGCWICRDMVGFLMRGWEIIRPGCGGTSALAREKTLAACWLHRPQLISNHPVGLGFLHSAGRYRPGGSASFSLGCSSCRDIEGFLVRNGKLSPQGAAAPRHWPERKLLPRAGSMGPSQSAITQWGWGFHTLWGGIGSAFSSPGC